LGERLLDRDIVIAYIKIDIGKASWAKAAFWNRCPPRLQQHRLQLQKRRQQLVRMNDIAFAVAFMGINNPTPSITGDGAAITP